ncbi:cytochrome P450 [Streptomyces sp. CC210A]|uniref:cytochrome P450 n=1 Tax=Streptomyces sp. CC210A TaxID=2898184 RepID=UPI001F1B33C5|nr:cytochrome P450 [Streptomyces sp. CC210A]
MDAPHRPLTDRTLAALFEGYAWLPDRMRRSPDRVVRTRVMGRPALAVRGPDAVRFFYDERNVHRHGALPGPILDTLFGRGGVQTLDGAAHRARRELFLPLMAPNAVGELAALAGEAWDRAVAAWSRRDRLVLLDEAGAVLTDAVFRWAGLPLPREAVRPVSGDLLALVDGFASLGPRHLRARAARRRQEDHVARVVDEVRAGVIRPPAESVLDRFGRHRDGDGRLLDPRTAAVELLNVLRPTVAVSWYVAFAAHALHRWPEHRGRLRAGDDGDATAFAHEVRRFYPFTPFLAGRAARDLSWRGEELPAGGLLILDVYGQDHDDELWGDPYAFRPQRFAGRRPGRDELIPQGGGDPVAGHRCPGEDLTVRLVATLSARLAALDYDVPRQDLSIPLSRIPARPRSGFVVEGVRGDPKQGR